MEQVDPKLAEFYDGKQAVVTGGCGMIGHQLVKLLLAHGAKVTVVDNETRGKQHVDGAKYFRPEISDARELPFLEYVFAGEKVGGPPVDMVFNLAADVGGVFYNQANSKSVLLSNMQLQVLPLIAAENAGVESFLQCSSVCIYPPLSAPFIENEGDEGEPHISNYGYGWAKRIGEKMALTSDIPFVVVARPSNCYGPGDYFDERSHVIPALIDRALNGPTVTVYGNPYNKREFIHSTDVAMGMMYIMAKGEDRHDYNVGCGGGNTVSIRQLATMIVEAAGVERELRIDYVAEYHDDEAQLVNTAGERYSNVRKIYAHTGWHYQVSLEEGLKELIEWRKAQLQ
jgi:nucleoside-diphosphate-sugar epimerase